MAEDLDAGSFDIYSPLPERKGLKRGNDLIQSSRLQSGAADEGFSVSGKVQVFDDSPLYIMDDPTASAASARRFIIKNEPRPGGEAEMAGNEPDYEGNGPQAGGPLSASQARRIYAIQNTPRTSRLSKLQKGISYARFDRFGNPTHYKVGNREYGYQGAYNLAKAGKLYDWQKPKPATVRYIPPLRLFCTRCGRNNHLITSCYARTKKDGTALPTLEYKWSNKYQKNQYIRPWIKKNK